MNTYELSRNFWNWSENNPEKTNANAAALYFYIIEISNRLGWKKKFGLPSENTKSVLNISSSRTYTKALNVLIENGFINIIQTSKNQHTAMIISIAVPMQKMHQHDNLPMQKMHQQNDLPMQKMQKHSTSTARIIKPIKPLKLKEEKNTKKDFLDFGFTESFNLWLKYKAERKQSYKGATSLKIAFENLQKLSAGDETKAMEIVKWSIANNYAGLFPLKQQNATTPPNSVNAKFKDSIEKSKAAGLLDEINFFTGEKIQKPK